MFDDYKVGGKFLSVKISETKNSNYNDQRNNDQRSSFSRSSSRSQSVHENDRVKVQTPTKSPSEIPRTMISDDGWTEIKKDTFDPLYLNSQRVDSSKRISSGRGSLLKKQETESPIRGQMNLSRPYARRLSTRLRSVSRYVS